MSLFTKTNSSEPADHHPRKSGHLFHLAQLSQAQRRASFGRRLGLRRSGPRSLAKSARRLHWLVLVLLALNILPYATLPLPQAKAATAPVSPVTPADLAKGETHTTPKVVDPKLPTLSVQLEVGPSRTLAVGDSAVVTLTVSNSAPDPANNLVVTLPLPQGAVALPDDAGAGAGSSLKGFVSPTDGWKWTLATVPARSETVFKANLKITGLPTGGALLLHAQVTATGLEGPVQRTGGAIVVAQTEHLKSPKDGAFQPGQATKLTSLDNSIEVSLPKDAYDAPLTLQHRPYAHKLPELQGAKGSIPTETAGFKRSFQPFFLEATTTDAKKAAVHQFKGNLTLTAHYTPQQLEALGISEQDLNLLWWDENADPALPVGVVSSATTTKDQAQNSAQAQTQTPGSGLVQKGRWVAILTVYDPQTHTATAQVNHFSAFSLGDGSSPSSAFIPSLQGWQDSLFTGGGSYSYPIDVPAGPGGLKPNLNLAYSSGATDGPGGLRSNNQASWVGKGWSLSTGMVALNKSTFDGSGHPTLVLNGQSYDLMQLSDQRGSTTKTYNTTDESYLKIQQQPNGVSSSGRGYYSGGTAQPRTKWQVWTKDGTLYEFAEDGWWGWNSPSFYLETNRWYLSGIYDTHGNRVLFNYDRSTYATSAGNNSANGWVDADIWPRSITWGGNNSQGSPDRFGLWFTSSARTADTNYDSSPFELGAARETRRLDAIYIDSIDTSGNWYQIRQYNLGYDYSLLSDKLISYGSNPVTNDTGSPKLTLKSITRVANDQSTTLPATTFTYGVWDGANTLLQSDGYNRLKTINNGQGGTINLNYESIGRFYQRTNGTNQYLFGNNQRLTSRVMSDGRGHSYTWGYSYQSPAYNSLGNEPNWMRDPSAFHTYPNSAVLFLDTFFVRGSRNYFSGAPIHAPDTEFRGHAQVTVTDPNSTQTIHQFIQGDVACGYAATSGLGSEPKWDNNIYNDGCFQQLRNQEMLKGKEYATTVKGPGGSPTYHQINHNYTVNFDLYGEPSPATYYPYFGLWHAFSYENQTDDVTFDPQNQGSTMTRHTRYFYDTAYQSDGQQYGNLSRTEEYDGGWGLLRKSENWFATKNSPSSGVAGSYMVDHHWASAVRDSQSRFLSLNFYFYDGNNINSNVLGAKGELSRVSKTVNLNLQSNLLNVSLQSSDSTMGYDVWGNVTSSSTYAGYGTAQNFTSGWGFSNPGNGSAARTTTTVYDPNIHLYPTQSNPPSVNGVTLSETAGYDYRMGLLTSVTDPNGNTTSAGYDVFGRLTSITKPGDPTGMPNVQTAYLDWEQPFRYQVAQLEVVAGSSSPVYRVTEQLYDGLGRAIQTKAESTFRSQMVVADKVYDGLGQVTKSSQPRYVSYTGDPTSNGFGTYQALDTDANERWTATAYDPLGRALGVTAPDGTVSTNSYNLGGHGGPQTTSTDANGHRVSRESDTFGRLSWVNEYRGNNGSEGAYALDATTTYSYNPVDQLTGVRDNKGNTTGVTYDSIGRKTAMSDPDMGNWAYAYDPNGNLVQQTDAKGQSISFNYDALNRLKSKTAIGLPTFADSFDSANGYNWSMNSHQTVPYNDGGNNVVANTGSGPDWAASYSRQGYGLTNGKTVQFRFKNDNLTGGTWAHFYLESTGANYQRFGIVATNGSIALHQYVNSTWGSNLHLLDGVQANTWYVVQIGVNDTNGFWLTVYQQNNPSVRATYTSSTPVTGGSAAPWPGLSWHFTQISEFNTTYLDDYQESSADTTGSYPAYYNYDEPWAANGKGQRTSMSNPNESVSWNYTSRSKVSQAVYSSVLGMSGTRTFDWTYDVGDQVATLKEPSLTDPGNANATDRETLTYTYDGASRPYSLCSASGGSFGGCYVSSAGYSALNQPTNLVESTGSINKSWIYSGPMQRLSEAKYSGNGGSNGNLFDRTYTYDGVGNVGSISAVGLDYLAGQTQNFQYDQRDRLVHAWTSGSNTTAAYNETDGYDELGNLTSKAGTAYAYPGGGQARPHTPTSVGGQAYTYDADGNLLSGSGRTLNWDVDNKPYSITSGPMTNWETYRYDPDGERVRRTKGSTTTVYLGGGSWEETLGGERRVLQNFNGQVVAQRSSTLGTTYLHSDHLGGASISSDYLGNNVQHQEFDPWGKVRSGGISSTTINYTGQRLDDGTGLLYYHARYYDPGLSRFLSADSVIPDSKVVQTLNRYSYIGNNPINGTDPSGHCEARDEYCNSLAQSAKSRLGAVTGDADNFLSWSLSQLFDLFSWLGRGVNFSNSSRFNSDGSVYAGGANWKVSELGRIVESLKRVSNFLTSAKFGFNDSQVNSVLGLSNGGLTFNKTDSSAGGDAEAYGQIHTIYMHDFDSLGKEYENQVYSTVHEIGHIIDYNIQYKANGGSPPGNAGWSVQPGHWRGVSPTSSYEDYANTFAHMVQVNSGEASSYSNGLVDSRGRAIMAPDATRQEDLTTSLNEYLR